ncbi:MAG: hypothetical protein EAY75_09910 [Bacteroidetes bacterium]|nr:MAG: hypothetical protein EAY75_09910 [Bacteroidota bacterium]
MWKAIRNLKGNEMELLTEFEIQHLNPVHHGYPAWPGGERWLQLYQTDASTQVVVTKGLSDGSGQPYEVYLETDDLISQPTFSSSWQANLIYELGKIIPNVMDFAERIEKSTFLSVQIQIDGAPQDWSLDDENGNIGLFIGLQKPLQMNLPEYSLPLNVKLMRPKELLYSIENGSAGRLELAERYLEQGIVTVSNSQRKSVI